MMSNILFLSGRIAVPALTACSIFVMPHRFSMLCMLPRMPACGSMINAVNAPSSFMVSKSQSVARQDAKALRKAVGEWYAC